MLERERDQAAAPGPRARPRAGMGIDPARIFCASGRRRRGGWAAAKPGRDAFVPISFAPWGAARHRDPPTPGLERDDFRSGDQTEGAKLCSFRPQLQNILVFLGILFFLHACRCTSSILK